MNFKGALDLNKSPFNLPDDCKPFSLELHQYGNKTFTNVYDVFYCSERVGTINANPRSNIIAADLIQFQLENHLFYTNTLSDLQRMVTDFVNYYAVTFEGINRLDIAIDTKENRLKYKDLYFDLLSGKKLLKGREKSISAHSVTKKGYGDFNGFSVGKRSSSRFLRIYNKSVSLRDDKTDKGYITEWHNKNGLTASGGLDIWRFEYQLNSRFFTDLRQDKYNITWQVFDYTKLVELFNMARKNHFEVVYNTGKSEVNKEREFVFIDFSRLVTTPHTFITKLKRIFTPSITIQKRLCKALFRQYYIEQGLHYLYPLIKVLREYNLKDWFIGKYEFYMREFKDKEKIKNTFNEYFFISHFDKLTA
jgi:hypothetical protein